MSHFHQGDCTRAQTLRSGEYIHEKKNLASETCLRIKEPLKIRGWIDFLVFFLLPSTSVCAVQIPFCTNNIFRVLSGLAWHGRILQDPFTLMKAYALRTTF